MKTKRVASTYNQNALLFPKIYHYYAPIPFMRRESLCLFNRNECERKFVHKFRKPLCRSRPTHILRPLNVFWILSLINIIYTLLTSYKRRKLYFHTKVHWTLEPDLWPLKGTSGTGFNSEEREKKIEQKSENLMKIVWKIRKFEVSQIFTKHFFKHRYEYANEWVDQVIASLLAIIFCTYTFWKIFKFCPNLG